MTFNIRHSNFIVHLMICFEVMWWEYDWFLRDSNAYKIKKRQSPINKDVAIDGLQVDWGRRGFSTVRIFHDFDEVLKHPMSYVHPFL